MMKRFLSPLVRFFALSALILLCLGLIVPLFMAGTTAGTTGPKIWVQDSQPLAVTYTGAGASGAILPVGVDIGAPQPVAMVQGDFGQDGVGDLSRWLTTKEMAHNAIGPKLLCRFQARPNTAGSRIVGSQG